MNIINKIAGGVQNTVPARKIEDAITTSLLSRGLEDIFEAQKPLTSVQKKVLDLADEIWHDMKMPEAVKPQVVFKSMFPFEMGGTDLSSCKMYLPNEDTKLLIDMALTGGPKATIAHEFRHTKQFYSIARLIGAEEFERVALEKRDIMLDRGWFEYVVQEMGRISRDSKEGKYAKKCLNAYIKYPEMERFENIIARKIKHFRYKHNFLERDARNFEKAYQETLLNKLSRLITGGAKP